MAVKRTLNTDKSIIKTFGLFWRRDHINWNKAVENGELWGYSHHRKSTERIDFNRQTGIYILYFDFKIVYVGQVGKGDKRTLFGRLKDYTIGEKAHRWNQFSWFGIKRVNQQGGLSGGGNVSSSKEIALSTIEAILIDGCEPLLNKQGGQWRNSTQYFQHSLERESLEKKIDTLIEKQINLEKLVFKSNRVKKS
jgi:hypothetical protein